MELYFDILHPTWIAQSIRRIIKTVSHRKWEFSDQKRYPDTFHCTRSLINRPNGRPLSRRQRGSDLKCRRSSRIYPNYRPAGQALIYLIDRNTSKDRLFVERDDKHCRKAVVWERRKQNGFLTHVLCARASGEIAKNGTVYFYYGASLSIVRHWHHAYWVGNTSDKFWRENRYYKIEIITNSAYKHSDTSDKTLSHTKNSIKGNIQNV